jgi:2-haloacid dehalogenase
MSNSSIRSIIFDFGGVLIRWDPHILFAKYFSDNSKAIDNFLDEINFHTWNLEQDKGYPFEKAVKELISQFPQYENLIKAYDYEWEESIIGLIPETVEILLRLKSNGKHLYGLTNWSSEKFSIVRQKYTIFEVFEDIVVSGEVRLIKPDPAIFNYFLQKHNYLPVDCLLVDDSKQNIDSARMLGFKTIHFQSPGQLKRQLGEIGIL